MKTTQAFLTVCLHGQSCPQQGAGMQSDYFIPASSSIKQKTKYCFTELITEAFLKILDT